MNSSLYSPTYLKQLCGQYDLRPSKQYGQNYLLSSGVIKKMIDAAQIQRGDTVIEIGPGFGVLTMGLLEQAGTVVSYEIEKKLKPYWDELELAHNNLRVVWGNALHQLPKDAEALPDTYIVAANLPYQITSQALRMLFELPKQPARIVVMVQKEVAQRICAKPGDMSLLAVSVQYYGQPKIVTTVPKGNFWPTPKVDSAVLLIEDIKRPTGDKEDAFFQFVRAGFANKRKQLWRNIVDGLGKDKDTIQGVLGDICGNERVRAQELSVEQWRALVDQCS